MKNAMSKTVCVAYLMAWLLLAAPAQTALQNCGGTKDAEPVRWLPPEYEVMCSPESPNEINSPYSACYLYNRSIVPNREELYHAKLGLECTTILRENDMIRAPVYCEEDKAACTYLESMEVEYVGPPYFRHSRQFLLSGSLPASTRNCHCQLATTSIPIPIKASNDWPERYSKPSELEDNDYFNLLVEREQAITIPADLKDYTNFPRGSVGTTLIPMPQLCRQERTKYPTLLRTHQHLVAFSVNPSTSLRLCPATVVRQTMLLITPSICRMDPQLSWNDISHCPNLGVVALVLPAPWNSHFVRELGRLDYPPATFYFQLPQHVTQYLVPKMKYIVTQAMLDPTVPTKPGDNNYTVTSTEDLTIEYPKDNCFIQFDFIIKNVPKDGKGNCAPVVYLGATQKTSPFDEKSLQFRVRAHMFCIILGMHLTNEKVTLPLIFIALFPGILFEILKLNNYYSN